MAGPQSTLKTWKGDDHTWAVLVLCASRVAAHEGFTQVVIYGGHLRWTPLPSVGLGRAVREGG